MRNFNIAYWKPIETAPLDEDVTVLVIGGTGDTYALPFAAKRTLNGWLSSRNGTHLLVTPVKWRASRLAIAVQGGTNADSSLPLR
jgi:hypothetical protein